MLYSQKVCIHFSGHLPVLKIFLIFLALPNRLAKYITNLRSGLAHQDDDLALMAELAQGPLNTFVAGQTSDANGTNGHAHTHTCVRVRSLGKARESSLTATVFPIGPDRRYWLIRCTTHP
jgi:hypothetical protein